jgi:uncharacterized coiled-coil protein SlyX
MSNKYNTIINFLKSKNSVLTKNQNRIDALLLELKKLDTQTLNRWGLWIKLTAFQNKTLEQIEARFNIFILEGLLD